MFSNPLSAFHKGQKIPFGPVSVSKEEIIRFAEKYDPIYFHLDEEAAKTSMLNGLAASGFHTCSLTMRMLCDAYLLQSTSQGAPGARDIRWHAPVRPDDTLHGFSTVLTSRISQSRPELFLVEFLHETLNQSDELVLSMKNTGFFKIKAEQS
ncbi:MAG: MaoC family dehydratase [Pseudomonadota bacterium]